MVSEPGDVLKYGEKVVHVQQLQRLPHLDQKTPGFNTGDAVHFVRDTTHQCTYLCRLGRPGMRPGRMVPYTRQERPQGLWHYSDDP